VCNILSNGSIIKVIIIGRGRKGKRGGEKEEGKRDQYSEFCYYNKCY